MVDSSERVGAAWDAGKTRADFHAVIDHLAQQQIGPIADVAAAAPFAHASRSLLADEVIGRVMKWLESGELRSTVSNLLRWFASN